MKLYKGDILFSYGTGFIQRIIEDVTHGASHCAVLCDEKGNIIEADFMRNVGFSDISQYSTNIRIYRLPNSNKNIDLGLAWLFSQFGRSYDYIDILILYIRCIFKFKIPWKEGKAILCSRLVRDFLFESKLSIPDENMTPRDVEDWVIANGGKLMIDTVA